MLLVNLIFVTVVVSGLMLEQTHGSNDSQLNVPENARTFYGTNGVRCFLFRSLYDLRSRNKSLYRAGKPILLLTTKAECQTQCPQNCETKGHRVCGEYAGLHMSFANDCELWKAACNKGLSIIRAPISKCHMYDYLNV